MRIAGQLKEVTKDLAGDYLLTFTVNRLAVNPYDLNKYKDMELLSLDLEKWSDRRSLSANAYFHVLVGKIAEKLTISKAKAKNMMIGRYGQPLLSEGQQVVFKTNAPPEYMEELETMHTIPLKFSEDATFYKVFRGSSTYTKEEMSHLIDGTVADAKDLGIETIPPSELERMKEAWKGSRIVKDTQ